MTTETEVRITPTVTVCGTTLTPEPFNEGRMDAWVEIKDRRGVDEAQQKRLTLTTKVEYLQGARIKAQQKAVEALEQKLEAEYAKDYGKWNRKTIEGLQEAIDIETGRLAEMETEDQDAFAKRATDLADELDSTAAVQEEAFLEMAHAIARQGPAIVESFEGWLKRATPEDYAAAQALVGAGLTPFMSRRDRRRKQKAGRV